MKQQITQAELRSVLERETAVTRQMMQIRERIRKGATIEPGELGAQVDGSDDFSPECGGFSNMGLTIDDAESIERQRLRWQRADAEAERRRSKITVIRGYAVSEVVTCQAR